VDPPEGFEGGAVAGEEEGGEVGDHQVEDKKGDEAGFVGEFFAEPDGADEEATDEETCDGDGYEGGPGSGEEEVEAAEEAFWREEAEAYADEEVVGGDEGEGEESPEDEGVGDAGGGSLLDDFGLAEDLPEEEPDAAAEGVEGEVFVLFCAEDVFQDGEEAVEEEAAGEGYCEEQQGDLGGGEVDRLVECKRVNGDRHGHPSSA